MRCNRNYLMLFVFLLTAPNLLLSQSNALYWFNKGRDASSQTKKIEFYKKAIELQPNFIEAHFNLGRAYKNEGKLNEAEQYFKNALICNPTKLTNNLKQPIYYELGLVYEKLERLDEAEESLLGALNLINDSSQKAMVLYRLGQVNVSMKRYQQAISYFEEGKKTNPENKTSFETIIALAQAEEQLSKDYEEGLNLVSQNRYEQAISIFERIVNTNPSYKDAQKLLDESIAAWKIKKDDLEITQIYNQGVAHFKSGNWMDAIKAFEKVVQQKSDFEKAQEYLKIAQQNFESSLKTKSLEQYYNEGIAAIEKHDYMSALVALEHVREIDPNYKEVISHIEQVKSKFENRDDNTTKLKYYNEGVLAFENERWDDALNAFTTLQAIDPNFKDVQYMIKNTREKLDDLAQSETIDIFYQRGLTNKQNEDWLNAIINFEKVKMINPDYKNVQALLSECNFKFKTKQDNFSETTESAGNKFSNTNQLLIIGIALTAIFLPLWGFLLFSPTARARFYLLQKRYDKARRIYENMINYNPDKVKLYISLANIYINENRKDEIAVRVFEKVIESNLSETLKRQLTPIVNKYYLERGKSLLNSQ